MNTKIEKKKRSIHLNRINQEICSQEIRLIGFHGEQIGLIGLREAIESAKEFGVDIVEINSNIKPPLCRMIDFGKFLYEKHKLFKEKKKKQRIIQTKEIKFRPNTDTSDYQTKLRNLIRFLKNGDKVKITVRFRGREITHQEIGMKIFDRIQKDSQFLSSIEYFSKKIENRQMTMILIPKK